MGKVIILLIVIVFAFQGAAGSSGLSVTQQQSSETPSTDPGPAIKVTITTGGGLFGPAKDRYKVGEQVPVTITMTNTTTQPIYVCDNAEARSSTLLCSTRYFSACKQLQFPR